MKMTMWHFTQTVFLGVADNECYLTMKQVSTCLQLAAKHRFKRLVLYLMLGQQRSHSRFLHAQKVL